MSTIARNIKEMETADLRADVPAERVEMISRGFTPRLIESLYLNGLVINYVQRGHGICRSQIKEMANAWGIR